MECNIRIIRRARFAAEEAFVAPIEALIDALLAEDPALFQLGGYSPAYHIHPLRLSGESKIPAFIMCSEIEWHHGRDAGDPTHGLTFFAPQTRDGADAVLKFHFNLAGDEGTHPGLVADLYLGSDVIIARGAAAAGLADRLFERLITIFGADFGWIDFGEQAFEYRDRRTPEAGWAVYRSQTELPALPELPPTAMVIRMPAGTRILATPSFDPSRPEASEDAIVALRESLGCPRPASA